MKRVVGVLVLALVGTLTGVAVTPSPASAQTASCNTTRTVSADVTDSSGRRMLITLPARGSSTECLLGRGNQGSAVTALQRTLNRCFQAGLRVDGIFGQLTERALEDAQSDAGTDDDGVYGRNTRDAFDNKRKWRAFSNTTGDPERCAGIL